MYGLRFEQKCRNRYRNFEQTYVTYSKSKGMEEKENAKIEGISHFNEQNFKYKIGMIRITKKNHRLLIQN